VAGHFGQGHKGGWRYPFLLYGGAGLAVSVVLLLVRACPCKSEYADADEEAAAAEQRRPSFRVPSVLRERQGSGRCCYHLWCTPSLPLVCFVLLLVCVPGAVLDVFMPDYLALIFFTERTAGLASHDLNGDAQRYAHKWAAAVARATDVSVSSNVGNAVGQLLGGLLGVCFSYAQLGSAESAAERLSHSPTRRRLRRSAGSGRRARLEANLTDEELARMPRCTKLLYLVLFLACAATPVPFAHLLFLTPSTSHRRLLASSVVGGALRGLSEPLTKAMVLGLLPPE
jgi:hypothetical protein